MITPLRRDANQVDAEILAEAVGSFLFEYGPGRNIAITEGILTAVFRKALDAELIAIPGREEPLS